MFELDAASAASFNAVKGELLELARIQVRLTYGVLCDLCTDALP
jgi:hypothetical protein